MYIRFAISKKDELSGCGRGVFRAAYDMRDSSDTPPDLSDRLRKLLRWFDNHLDAAENPHPHCVFWFKSEAQEVLLRVWELVELLRLGGCSVRQITCKRPGKIL